MKALLGSALLLFSALSIPPAHADAPFTVQMITEPPSLDWTLAADTVSGDPLFNIMEGLLQFDEQLTPVPALAESFKVSAGGTVYTFTLKANVQWSDGQPLKAQHFVDSWLRLLDPMTTAQYAYMLYPIKNAKAFNERRAKASDVAIKAINDRTLQVTLEAPASFFPHILTFWNTFPVRLDIISKYGKAWTEAGKIVTLGPYVLSEWQHDNKLVLRANPRYYGTQPSIKEIAMLIVTENSTALNLFETKKIDFMRAEIPPMDMPRYEKRPEFKQCAYLRGYYYSFNVHKKPFDNVRVRKAFAMAVDKTHFPKILKQGQIPTDSWIPKGLLGYDASLGIKYNPDAARKSLSEAGYPDAKGFPRVTMMFDTREENKIVAEALQEMWKRVLNVDLQIENQEWKMYLSLLRTDAGPALFKESWGADYPDPDNFMNLFTSYSGNNYSKWKSPRYDALIHKAQRLSDPKKRFDLYSKAQRLLLEDETVMIPLYQQQLNMLVSSRVKRVWMNSMNVIYFKHWRL